jgi:hypothetical protein
VTFQDHATAILTAVAATPGSPALTVHDGFVPAPTKMPYALVYFAFDSPEPAEDTESSDLAGNSNRVDCSVYVHSVAASSMGARAVAARVRTALLDVTLTGIAGRSAFPIRMVDSQPVQRDEATGTPVYDQTDVYRLSTVPA